MNLPKAIEATYKNDLFIAMLRASMFYHGYHHRRPRFIERYWRRVLQVYPNIDHINMLSDLVMVTFTPKVFKLMRRREGELR